jgi:hypothetical protein
MLRDGVSLANTHQASWPANGGVDIAGIEQEFALGKPPGQHLRSNPPLVVTWVRRYHRSG